MRTVAVMMLIVGLLVAPSLGQIVLGGDGECGNVQIIVGGGAGVGRGEGMPPMPLPPMPAGGGKIWIGGGPATSQPDGSGAWIQGVPGGQGWMQLPPQFKPEMVKATYMGVAVVPANPALRSQLALPEGVGLTVVHVDPEGPAKTAKIEAHDVLWKLNDQLLINPEQLTVLVRTFKAGDEVKLTVFRQAKPQAVAVKLAEKEQPKLGQMMGNMDVQIMPPMGGIGGVAGMLPALPPGDGAAAMGQCMISDGEHEITLTQTGASRRLLAKDKNGKVLYDGPIDTPEQKAKVPAEVMKKVDGMNVQINVNPFAPGAPDPDVAPAP